ncbi:MAG: hypothetical protein AAF677_18255 [Pseudomonadota bacterium]
MGALGLAACSMPTADEGDQPRSIVAEVDALPACPAVAEDGGGVRLTYGDGATDTVWADGPTASVVEIRDPQGRLSAVLDTEGGAFLTRSRRPDGTVSLRLEREPAAADMLPLAEGFRAEFRLVRRSGFGDPVLARQETAVRGVGTMRLAQGCTYQVLFVEYAQPGDSTGATASVAWNVPALRLNVATADGRYADIVADRGSVLRGVRLPLQAEPVPPRGLVGPEAGVGPSGS